MGLPGEGSVQTQSKVVTQFTLSFHFSPASLTATTDTLSRSRSPSLSHTHTHTYTHTHTHTGSGYVARISRLWRDTEPNLTNVVSDNRLRQS